MKALGLMSFCLFGIISCSSSPVGDHDYLTKNTMEFNQEGADFSECGIVSQFETGRAAASQVAGGG